MRRWALRFFNIYGPYQALSNPYTGVLAIFAARYLNNKPPLVFEDGLQRRDFVNVRDVARACRLAMEKPHIAGESFNVGSGLPLTVCEVAERMAVTLSKEHIEPEVTGDYRVGDIRHCFADITKARARLGYAPQVSFEEGLVELASWLEGQVAIDSVPQARAELPVAGAGGMSGLEARPVLITGGAGFVGTNLAHRLLQRGRPVRLFDKPLPRGRGEKPGVAPGGARRAGRTRPGRRPRRRRLA